MRRVTWTFIPVASPRFVTLEVDITGDTDTSGLAFVDLGHAAEAHDLTDAIVRFRLTATSEQMRRVDIPFLRAALADAGARVVTVEPQIIREQRARAAGVDEQLDELAALELWIEATSYDGDSDALRVLARDLLEAGA